MDFAELVEARRSVRAYSPCEISRGEIAGIVKAAVEAPSWKNRAPARYRVVRAGALMERLRREALPPSNCAKAEGAAAMAAVTFKRGESGFTGAAPDNEFGEGWGAYDAGLASAYFLLAARDRGWDTLVIGLRDEAKVRGLLEIPEDETLTAIILLGKAKAPPAKMPRVAVESILDIVE